MSDEMQEILRRLTNIELGVASIDETTAFVARPQRVALLAEVDKLFGNRKRQAQAYLASNGRRSLTQICDHIGSRPNNVSPFLSELEAEGLLGYSVHGGSKVYFKKAIDRTLGIAKHLQSKFKLTRDGLPAPEESP